MKAKFNLIVTAAGLSSLLIAGCGPRDQDVVVEQPDRVIERETTVKPIPQEKDTVIVQQQPETKTETDVKVTVEATPAPAAKSKGTSRPSAPNQTQATPRPQAAPATQQRPASTSTTRPQQATANLVVRGEVMSTSKVPDPKTVPYKDALVFTKYRVLEVQRGKYAPREILVAHWGMRDRKLQPAARVREGQRHTLELVPLAGEKELESIMRLDDTGEFELEPYFASESP